MSFRPRSSAGVASIALAGLLGLSACTSTPSNRRVVLDQIEALGLPDDQETCMKDVLATYDNDQLDDMTDAGDNENLDWTDPNVLELASPELQEFVERLNVCVPEGEPTTTDAADTTEAAEASETTEASDTTEG